MELDEDSETSTYGLQNRCSAAELIQRIGTNAVPAFFLPIFLTYQLKSSLPKEKV